MMSKETKVNSFIHDGPYPSRTKEIARRALVVLCGEGPSPYKPDVKPSGEAVQPKPREVSPEIKLSQVVQGGLTTIKPTLEAIAYAQNSEAREQAKKHFAERAAQAALAVEEAFPIFDETDTTVSETLEQPELQPVDQPLPAPAALDAAAADPSR